MPLQISFLSNPQIKNSRRELLLTQKVYNIIQQNKMAGINKKKLQQDIAKA
jgi:LAO/AO transport system kinase